MHIQNKSYQVHPIGAILRDRDQGDLEIATPFRQALKRRISWATSLSFGGTTHWMIPNTAEFEVFADMRALTLVGMPLELAVKLLPRTTFACFPRQSWCSSSYGASVA